jgi:hypothetical protein
MADLPEDLRSAAEDQAKARVEMSIQGYAKYLTPEATDSLRASTKGMPSRVSRFEVDAVEGGGDRYTIDVRYFQRDESFVVRSRWQRRDEAWMVVHAERQWREGEAGPGLISRALAKVLGPIARLRR